MERVLLDNILEWQFWVHPRGGSDYYYRYAPTKLASALRQRERLLKDEFIARVEPIVAVIAQSEEEKGLYILQTNFR